ncbi:MAG: hypothetical protein L3J68_00190 [Thermoplasmata archaeon]|nr:hypothetical protein [Thermoplasmata archaeon]
MSTVRPSTEDLQKMAEAWLRKTGYPLEIRTARTLRQAGFSDVSRWPSYRSESTGKFREIDIRTQDVLHRGSPDVEFTVNCVFECVYSADQPWIIFPHDGPDSSLFAEWDARLWTGASYYMGKAIAEYLDEEGVPPNLITFPSPFGYGIRQVGFHAGKSKDREAKDDLPEADEPWRDKVAQVIDAALAILSTQGGAANRGLVLPVLVLDGELFEVRLGDGDDFELKAGPGYASILVERIGFSEPSILVQVATERALPAFAKSLREHIDEFEGLVPELIKRAYEIANRAAIVSLAGARGPKGIRSVPETETDE